MRTLIVTGAGGYIGRHLVAAAQSDGWRVIAATRQPDGRADDWLPYRLEDPVSADAWPHGAVIVHLAADTQHSGDSEMEVAAADRLLSLAAERNAHLVFASSQTARPDAPTHYGRTKWAIEQHVLRTGGVVVRPGLVYGGTPGGVYARLLQLVSKSAVLPMPMPSPRVQPVHVEDLIRAFLVCASNESLGGRVLHVAAPASVAFDRFLRSLATARGKRAPRFMPVPAIVVPLGSALLRAAGAATLAARVTSLRSLPPMTVNDDLAQLGVSLRSLDEGLRRRYPQRRRLLAEGAALLRYVLARPAPGAAVRRYARLVETLRNGKPLGLPAFFGRCPALLRTLDQRSWLRRRAELDWRFDAAFAVAEATPQGARRLIAAVARHPLATVIRVAGVGIVEVVARVVGAPLRAVVGARFDA